MAKGLYKGKVWDKYFGWRVAEREERAVEKGELLYHFCMFIFLYFFI